MKKLILAASAVLCLTSPASAQSAQDQLDARYDRALAAGYKALFLCSAIANAEANGATRTAESVHDWELTGIYPKLDPIIRGLKYEIVRSQAGKIAHVEVEWAEDMLNRVAVYRGPEAGCSVMPIGLAADGVGVDAPVEISAEEEPKTPKTLTLTGRVKSDPTPKPERSALERVLDGAMQDAYGKGRSTAVLVRAGEGTFLDGKSLVERARFGPGFNAKTPQRTWSVAKSIASTLVGAAVYRGEADVTASAGFGADESDPRRAVTIDDTLRMASGRYSDTPGNRTDPLYWGGTTVDERAQNWPLIHAPGTVYRYANNDTLAAVKAIEGTFAEHPPADIFAKIGMNYTVAETDWQGNYVLSSQVWSTARDLAKLGQLYLQDGVWEGERILPENWREYVSTPSGPQPNGPFGYGAGWWLMNNSEGIPSDTFAAFGNRGQYVVVVPSRNVVIVRRGEDMVGTRFDIAAFTRDVLAALD